MQAYFNERQHRNFNCAVCVTVTSLKYLLKNNAEYLNSISLVELNTHLHTFNSPLSFEHFKVPRWQRIHSQHYRGTDFTRQVDAAFESAFLYNLKYITRKRDCKAHWLEGITHDLMRICFRRQFCLRKMLSMTNCPHVIKREDIPAIEYVNI